MEAVRHGDLVIMTRIPVPCRSRRASDEESIQLLLSAHTLEDQLRAQPKTWLQLAHSSRERPHPAPPCSHLRSRRNTDDQDPCHQQILACSRMAPRRSIAGVPCHASHQARAAGKLDALSPAVPARTATVGELSGGGSEAGLGGKARLGGVSWC